MTGRDVAVAGIGSSAITRDGNDAVEQLAVDACRAALEDAGITGADVDGVFQYSFGWDSPDSHYMQRTLGIPDLAAYADIGAMGPSGLGGALAATMAIASGACETAVVFRAISQRAGNTGSFGGGGAPTGQMGDNLRFTVPYGYAPIIPAIAMMMRRRIDELDASIEDYGYIAINARRWSAMNERAVLREPVTMDEYLHSRVLAEPLHLLDCDYPVSGATAVVMTSAARARDMRGTPVLVDAMAYASGPDPDWLQAEDFLFGATRRCAERLWGRSSLTARDVDLACLYDGFTHITISWLEALGFCGIGEAGAFIDAGRTIGPGGKLPLNPHGGQLAEGRLHGLRHLAEATAQLRGECGPRQVPNAKAAVVSNGHGPQCGALVLRTE